MSRGASAARKRWLGLLRLALAACLLWFVAANVPWQDTLLLTRSEGDEPHRLTGELQGEWKGEVASFRLDAGQPVPDDIAFRGDSPLRSAVEQGGTIEVAPGVVSSPRYRAGPDGLPRVDPEQARHEDHFSEVAWRPGMPRAFADLNIAGLVPGLGLLALGTLFAITRWWRLLRFIGCPSTWGAAFRLTYVGLFFNLVLPGLNGGDLARALLAVREHPERRADALVSVVVDRLIGLIAMITLSAAVIFSGGEHLAMLRLPVGLTLLGLVGGLFVFRSRRLRKLIHFETIVDRLPQAERIRKVDHAFTAFIRHPAELGLAFVLSIGNHLSVTGAILIIGHAFGDTLGYLDYLAVVTVSNTVSSLPLAPGGWGVGEAVFGKLFSLLDAAPTIGVAASVTYRLLLAALGLGGGLFLLLPGSDAVRAQLAASRSTPAPDSPQPPSLT